MATRQRCQSCSQAMKHPYYRTGSSGSYKSLKDWWYCEDCDVMRQDIQNSEVDNMTEKYKKISKQVLKSYNVQERRIRRKLRELKFSPISEKDIKDGLKSLDLKVTPKDLQTYLDLWKKFKFQIVRSYFYDFVDPKNGNEKQRNLDVKAFGTLISGSNFQFNINLIGEIKDTRGFNWLFQEISDDQLDKFGGVDLVIPLPDSEKNWHQSRMVYLDQDTKRKFVTHCSEELIVFNSKLENKHNFLTDVLSFFEQMTDGVSNYITENKPADEELPYYSIDFVIPVCFISNQILVTPDFETISDTNISQSDAIIYSHAPFHKRGGINNYRMPILIINEHNLEDVIQTVIFNLFLRLITIVELRNSSYHFKTEIDSIDLT